jgi:sodium/hydrogen exchanger-like protein 6/7
MSGIIALLTSGIIMAHYGWYNLSPQGKHVSCVAFQVIGFLAEAFVFIYLGLSYFYYASYDWSYSLILVEFAVIIVGRFCATTGLVFTLMICKHKPKVTFKQSLFIGYAGLIRGAIAFGLVLTIPHEVEG